MVFELILHLQKLLSFLLLHPIQRHTGPLGYDMHDVISVDDHLAFFAAGSAKRQAAEAGIHRLVSAREADDMVRQVAAFLELVDSALGDTVADSARERQRRTF